MYLERNKMATMINVDTTGFDTWLNNNYVHTANDNDCILSSDLYDKYRNGTNDPLTLTAFGKLMNKHYSKKIMRYDNGRAAFYCGIQSIH